MERLSAKEASRRWKALLASAGESKAKVRMDEDPFDCKELVVLPEKVQVDQILNVHGMLWRDLDSRKIHPNERNRISAHADQSTKRRVRFKALLKKRFKSRVRLPDNFDYASKNDGPPEDDGSGDRVVSLEDPNTTLSYERELWKLFHNVPTVSELRKDLMEGAQCKHMRAFHGELQQALRELKSLGQFGLCNMRMRDMHSLPDPKTTDTVNTIRVECWRSQPKSRPTPDAERMELEFLTSQTLLDVHTAIVELAEDLLWDETGVSAREASGFFLIEDTFYTAGSVDYTTPILKWLGENDAESKIGSIRRKYLGLSETLHLRKMAACRIDSIPVRLGVRYLHVHHGDFECSFFFSDIRTKTKAYKRYPLIHDAWEKSYPLPFCDACTERVATLVTPPDDEISDGGPRSLCRRCHKALHGAMGTSVQELRVWREQGDVSAWHNGLGATF